MAYNRKRYVCTCEICGSKFRSGQKDAKFCSPSCRVGSRSKKLAGQREAAQKERDRKIAELKAMRARLAARDAAYKAAFPQDATGDVRGNRFAGAFGFRQPAAIAECVRRCY